MQQVLAELSQNEDDYQMTLDDITLLSSNAPLVSLVRKVMKAGSKKSGIRLTNSAIDGTFIDDAYIYRVS